MQLSRTSIADDIRDVAACWADLIGARVSNPAAASKIYIAAGGVGVKQFREKKTNRIVAT